MEYRLLLLGPPLLLRGSAAVHIKSRKGLALLCYLAANPDRMYPREHLHGLLWTNQPSDSARRDFNTMISRLRGEVPLDCVRRSATQLGWNPDAGFSTDVGDFLQWTKGVETDPAAPLDPRQKEHYRQAIALWRGPFLDGFSPDSELYEEWLLAERRRWEVRVVAACDRLIAAERADGRWDQVAACARRGLEVDPVHESFYRALIEALFRQGNRSGALAEFERCRRVLEEELGTTPDEATLALMEIVRGTAGATATVTDLHPDPRRERDSAASEPSVQRVRPEMSLAGPGPVPPLVGRDDEYAQLRSLISRTALQGPSRIILLVGEAGVGKTRLMSEILQALAKDALHGADIPTILAGRAYESMANVPYAALADALGSAQAASQHVWSGLPDVWLRELGRIVPDIFERRPDLYPPLPMGSGDDQLRLFQAVARFLSLLPQPVLLALDDLQWADPFTIALLDYLLRRPASQLRLVAVAAVREGEESPVLHQALVGLEREGRAARISLGNLTPEATLALTDRLFPEHGAAQASRVYAQTKGHPLYTVELIAMLRERGEDAGSEPVGVPPTMQNLVLSRLARLGEEAAEVAEALAVFDRGATLEQLARATHFPEATVVPVLDKLARAGIIMETPQGHIDFTHDVFRQVVVGHMSPARLAYRHRQAHAALVQDLTAPDAASLASETADPHRLASLVTHAVQGQLWEDGLNWARKAAAAAERLYAFRSALDYLNTALHCLAQLPPTDDRRRERLELELQAIKLDRWSPAALRDQRLLAAARLAQEIGAVEFLPRIRMLHIDSLVLQGRCREALALTAEMAPLASKDRRLAFALEVWQGAGYAIVGDVRRAIVHLTKVREALAGEILKPGTSVHGALASCYAAAGEFDKALACLEDMKQEEAAQGYQSLTSKYLIVAATVEYWRGQWRQAAAFAREALPISREAEDPANEMLAALWLGASVLELVEAGADKTGDLEISLPAATAALEAALDASERGQVYTRREFVYAFLARAYAASGQLDKAAEAVTAGLRLAEETGAGEGAALCWQAKGCVAAVRGDLSEAEHCLRTAAERFEQLGHGSGARVCWEQLARLRDTGHPHPLRIS